MTGAAARVAQAPGYRRLEATSGMVGLLAAAARAATRRPYSWFRDSVEQGSLAIGQSTLPLLISITFFCIGTVVTLINGILVPLGAPDRFAGVVETGLIRETNVWVTTMVVAGVLGSAITADLGSRKVREELDAIRVLGVDPVRSLVVPRVVGVTLAMPVLGLIALLISVATLYLVGPALIPNHPPAVFIESIKTYLDATDLASYLAKLTVFGVFLAVVACYKGMNASGGSEGVGRAVNQTVLITFFGSWLMNSLWNLAVLALAPDLSALRG